MLLAIYTTIVMFLLFGITIFIHELGHFLMARYFGMQVDVFSIGFGHAIWKKTRNGIDYKIGWIPFGGYVALPQMDAAGGKKINEDGKEVPLPHVEPWKKILVALAGPIGNIVLAVFISYIIYFVGKPSAPQESSSVVGFASTNSVAYQEGLRVGDYITAVNGEEVKNWQDLRILCALYEEVTLSITSEDGEKTLVVPTVEGWAGVREIEGISGAEYCKVLSTSPDSSAEAAGILPNDLIISLNDIEVHSIPHLIDLVNQYTDQQVPIQIQRNGELLELNVTPKFDPDLQRALIGVSFNTYYVDSENLVYPTPWAQLKQHALPIFRILLALVTPREARAAAGSLGGPPAILWSLWIIIQSSFVMALWFTCFLNINLVILNLLPFPVLDGGHILFSLWEIVTRRPIHHKVVNGLTYAFASVLICLMIYLSYRDVIRLILPMFSSPSAPPQTEQVESTDSEPAP